MFTLTTASNNVNGQEHKGFNLFITQEAVFALQGMFIAKQQEHKQLQEHNHTQPTKKCPKCQQAKAHTEYYQYNGKPVAYCKQCNSEYNRQKYQEKKVKQELEEQNKKKTKRMSKKEVKKAFEGLLNEDDL